MKANHARRDSSATSRLIRSASSALRRRTPPFLNFEKPTAKPLVSLNVDCPRNRGNLASSHFPVDWNAYFRARLAGLDRGAFHRGSVRANGEFTFLVALVGYATTALPIR